MLAPSEEAMLVREARRGCPSAFGALFNEYKPFVYGTARKYLHDQVQADDVVQEVFAKLMLHISDLKSDHLSTWLATTTVRQCFDVMRRKKRILREADTGQHNDCDFLAVIGVHLRDDNDPEEVLLTKELAELISRSLRLLTREERLAVILRIDGMDALQAAKRIGCSIDQLYTYRSRGCAKLRKQLEKYHNFRGRAAGRGAA